MQALIVPIRVRASPMPSNPEAFLNHVRGLLAGRARLAPSLPNDDTGEWCPARNVVGGVRRDAARGPASPCEGWTAETRWRPHRLPFHAG
jgi:hypothetical protein